MIWRWLANLRASWITKQEYERAGVALAEGFEEVKREVLRERLAALEHAQWASWTEYMLEALGPLYWAEGTYSQDEYDLAELRLTGWKRQIKTPYAELSEAEKDSDREWADKVLEAVEDSGGTLRWLPE